MIDKFFDLLAVAFDKIPVLNKLKKYRTVLGLFMLGGLYLMDSVGIGGGQLGPTYLPYLSGFIGLALNAKGRD